ncbi:CRAL/TRIO domain-containing protein, partial [Ceraceosorus guamensis]
MSLPALDREASRLSKASGSTGADKGRVARIRSGVWGAAGRAASVASVATLGTLNGQSEAQQKAEDVQLNGFTGVFPVPAPGCRPAPPAALTTAQSEAYDKMLRYFKQDVTQYPISLATGAAKQPATEWEKLRLLSRESMLRYLRATKWDVSQAQKRLTETIAWRREFGVDKLDPDEMAHEAKSGKETVLGYDNKARPLHYMHPHRNDTKETPRQMQFAVWILERSVDLMPPGIEQLALLINFDHRSRNPTSIANAKLMLYILQNHYVERLGVALCINVPWIFKAFWSAIQPFIDPVTKSKCKFDEAIKDEVPSEQLSADFGGTLDPKYNHDAYWPDLVKTCDERREQMMRRFKEMCNSEVGASEWVILGGDDKEAPFNKKDLAAIKRAGTEPDDHVEAAAAAGN